MEKQQQLKPLLIRLLLFILLSSSSCLLLPLDAAAISANLGSKKGTAAALERAVELQEAGGDMATVGEASKRPPERMDVEVEDYPRCGANDRHNPPHP